MSIRFFYFNINVNFKIWNAAFKHFVEYFTFFREFIKLSPTHPVRGLLKLISPNNFYQIAMRNAIIHTKQPHSRNNTLFFLLGAIIFLLLLVPVSLFYGNNFTTYISIAGTMFIVCFTAWYFNAKFLNSLKIISQKANEISKGKLDPIPVNFKNNELNQISTTFNDLLFDEKNAQQFINEIGNGNLEIKYNNLDQGLSRFGNSLAQSLLRMRDKMKEIAEKEEERSWITTGLAKFAEILRENNQSLEELSNNILSNLVKYIGAVQGGLFILNDQVENEEDNFLELKACYAYDRKKFVEKTVSLGQGLIGQCFLERATIYLTEVPDNYVNITSGLGESNPQNLILIPLKINEEVYGIIELASFEIIDKYKIEFLEKLGENIASSISSTKTNEHTKTLLERQQEQSEELRAQEEEMRQNLEELQATQESQTRLQKELQQKVSVLEIAKKEMNRIRKTEAAKTKKEIEAKDKLVKSLEEKLSVLQQKMEEKDAELEALKN